MSNLDAKKKESTKTKWHATKGDIKKERIYSYVDRSVFVWGPTAYGNTNTFWQLNVCYEFIIKEMESRQRTFRCAYISVSWWLPQIECRNPHQYKLNKRPILIFKPKKRERKNCKSKNRHEKHGPKHVKCVAVVTVSQFANHLGLLHFDDVLFAHQSFTSRVHFD